MLKIISDLAPKNSCGVDHVSSKLLKRINIITTVPLAHIINQSLCTVRFPNRLKLTRVVSLYEKDDQHLVENHRLISCLPEASFGFQVLSLRASVCVNHLLVRAITWDPFKLGSPKFGPKMQKTLVMVPSVLWTDWPWPSRSNLTWNSKLTPFWACPHYNSPLIQARITKFGPDVQKHWPRTLLFWEAIDPDLQGQIWLNKKLQQTAKNTFGPRTHKCPWWFFHQNSN